MSAGQTTFTPFSNLQILENINKKPLRNPQNTVPKKYSVSAIETGKRWDARDGSGLIYVARKCFGTQHLVFKGARATTSTQVVKSRKIKALKPRGNAHSVAESRF